MFIKAKKALIQRLAFLKLPINLVQIPVISFELAHTKVTKEIVAQALLTQIANKALGLNKFNFQILQIVWSQNKTQIATMVYHIIRLGYYLME